MSFLDGGLLHVTSNALGMMVSYDNFGDKLASWTPPRTERDGFWEKTGPGMGSDPGTLGFPSGLKEDVTVCKTGKCRYKTVQEAVNAAPDNNGVRKFVIKISEGVYEETVRVPFEKKNVVFIGDGVGKTVITGSLNARMPGMSTFKSATVGEFIIILRVNVVNVKRNVMLICLLFIDIISVESSYSFYFFIMNKLILCGVCTRHVKVFILGKFLTLVFQKVS